MCTNTVLVSAFHGILLGTTLRKQVNSKSVEVNKTRPEGSRYERDHSWHFQEQTFQDELHETVQSSTINRVVIMVVIQKSVVSKIQLENPFCEIPFWVS